MLKIKIMKNVYDIIIIGSGLNALATLYGILQSKKKYKIALIAGKANFNVKYNHPKLFNDFKESNSGIKFKPPIPTTCQVGEFKDL